MSALGLSIGLGLRGRAAAFSPLTVAGLAAAYTGVATVIGGKVAVWPDQSGAGDSARDALQADAGSRPTYTAVDAGYNGQATLTFPNVPSATYLQTGTWSAPLDQPATYYLVGEASADTGGCVFFDGIDGAARQLLASTGGFAGTHLELYAGSILDGGPVAVAPHVVAVVFAGASSALYVDDATTALASGAGGALSIAGLTFGVAENLAANPLAGGKIAAVYAYAGAHAHTLRSAIMAWLGTKYGITVTA